MPRVWSKACTWRQCSMSATCVRSSRSKDGGKPRQALRAMRFAQARLPSKSAVLSTCVTGGARLKGLHQPEIVLPADQRYFAVDTTRAPALYPHFASPVRGAPGRTGRGRATMQQYGLPLLGHARAPPLISTFCLL